MIYVGYLTGSLRPLCEAQPILWWGWGRVGWGGAKVKAGKQVKGESQGNGSRKGCSSTELALPIRHSIIYPIPPLCSLVTFTNGQNSQDQTFLQNTWGMFSLSGATGNSSLPLKLCAHKLSFDALKKFRVASTCKVTFINITGKVSTQCKFREYWIGPLACANSTINSVAGERGPPSQQPFIDNLAWGIKKTHKTWALS